jgi:hypothetical protein
MALHSMPLPSPPDSARALRPTATRQLATHPTTQIRPLPFLHPTRAEFRDPHAPLDAPPVAMWWSRASRKRRLPRRPVRIAHDAEEKVGAETSHIEQRLHHPEAKFKVGVTADVSFWVAIFFLIGSCAWV